MTTNFLISKYLNPTHLSGFDKYKYSSIDNSPISVYITHPFWNQCVKVWSRDNPRNLRNDARNSLGLLTFTLFLHLIPFYQLCPLWLAPNLMTFVGFLLLLSNFFLLTFFDPHFFSTSGGDETSTSLYVIPTWVWYFCAASQFLAHTLDGCDGKQVWILWIVCIII